MPMPGLPKLADVNWDSRIVSRGAYGGPFVDSGDCRARATDS